MNQPVDENTIGACGLHFGTVCDLMMKADQPPKVRVRLPQLNNLRSPWLKMIQPKTLKDKVYWMPDMGEQLAVLLDAACETGVVLGSVYSKVDAAPALGNDVVVMQFGDGTRLEYNRATHVLTANVVGDVVMQASGNVQIGAKAIALTADSVTINGPTTLNNTLHVTQAVTMAAEVKTGALQVDGDANISGKLSAAGNLQSKTSVLDKLGPLR